MTASASDTRTRQPRVRVRVRYAETDRMGVVYYANYLIWFEVGRTEWLRHSGWSYRQMEHEGGVQLPVIEAHCEYRQPARYDDEIDIRPGDASHAGAYPFRLRGPASLRRDAVGRRTHHSRRPRGRWPASPAAQPGTPIPEVTRPGPRAPG